MRHRDATCVRAAHTARNAHATRTQSRWHTRALPCYSCRRHSRHKGKGRHLAHPPHKAGQFTRGDPKTAGQRGLCGPIESRVWRLLLHRVHTMAARPWHAGVPLHASQDTCRCRACLAVAVTIVPTPHLLQRTTHTHAHTRTPTHTHTSTFTHTHTHTLTHTHTYTHTQHELYLSFTHTHSHSHTHTLTHSHTHTRSHTHTHTHTRAHTHAMRPLIT